MNSLVVSLAEFSYATLIVIVLPRFFRAGTKMKVWNFKYLVAGLMLALCCTSVKADVFDLDFETDPEDMGIEFFGTSEWREDDGFDDTGYLSITDALNGQRGAIVFPDLANGESLKAFSIEADLRVGGGTSRPADGFSFNFARPGDPVLDDGEGWASSPTNEGNLPEEGTTTGLAIGFDEWFSGGSDVVGMSIRLDNDLVDQYEFPLLNGEVDDQDSLQTGPEGVFDDELQDMMDWAHLSIELCANNLSVKYKDVEVFDQVVEYDPTPGLLVFGGRTGGANAYHHIDNIQVKTGTDVGEGCVIIPPSYVAGENVIGTRTFDATVSNQVFGPEQPGVSGHSGRIVTDTGLTIDSMTVAEEILEDEEGDVGSYPVVDMAGGGGTFPVNLPYPNGVAGTGQEDFAVETVAEVVIPAGTWTVGFGSDDGGALTIPGVEFTVTSDTNDSFDDDQIRFEGTRGHGWTVGTFTLDEPLETAIIGQFFERGGGDSFEIAVIEGEVIEDASPDNGWELLGDGTLDWSVKHTGVPLVSADLNASVVAERPLEFDVNGDSGSDDQLAIENPDSEVYTTILDVDGVTFQIKGVGSFSTGESFSIVDADQITGTPILSSLDPSQTWAFDAENGLLCYEVCAGTLVGDYNGNGLLDAEDLDLNAAVGIPSQDLAYDLNNDGLVNTADRKIWVNDLKNTWMGDADLNGVFDSGDLVTVFAAAKYETGQAASWGQGDWNGDQKFDSGDLVEAFSNAGYNAGQRPGGPNPATAAVPEPSSLVLAMLSLFGLVGFARRRK